MTMTPDQCFDEMAVALGVPKDTGYTDLLELVKKLKEKDKEWMELMKGAMSSGLIGKVEKLTEENKKLKEEYENYAMTHCCDMSCEDCGLTTTEDDLQISLKYGSLICEECYDKKDEEDDEPPDCCEGCGEKFDLQYTLNHADKQLREKYDKYMGSEEDDGDLCQICLDSNY